MSSGGAKAKSQTVDTGGLYGSSKTGSRGTTYNASDFEKNLVNQTTSAIPQYLQQMINPTYDSEIFKAQTQQRNRLANQSFENNLINPLASRGLTRGSSINQMSGQFANKLADLETDAMANEDTRMANVLNNLFSYYQTPYNMMSGLQNQSNSLYANAVQAAAQENAAKQQMLGNIATAVGTIGGYALGGPLGGALANRLMGSQTPANPTDTTGTGTGATGTGTTKVV